MHGCLADLKTDAIQDYYANLAWSTKLQNGSAIFEAVGEARAFRLLVHA